MMVIRLFERSLDMGVVQVPMKQTLKLLVIDVLLLQAGLDF